MATLSTLIQLLVPLCKKATHRLAMLPLLMAMIRTASAATDQQICACAATVWEHANYQGHSITLGYKGENSDLSQWPGVSMHRRISSAKIHGEGCSLVLYQSTGFRGPQLRVWNDTGFYRLEANHESGIYWNDVAYSMRLEPEREVRCADQTRQPAPRPVRPSPPPTSKASYVYFSNQCSFDMYLAAPGGGWMYHDSFGPRDDAKPFEVQVHRKQSVLVMQRGAGPHNYSKQAYEGVVSPYRSGTARIQVTNNYCSR